MSQRPRNCPCGFSTTSYKAQREHRRACTWRPEHFHEKPYTMRPVTVVDSGPPSAALRGAVMRTVMRALPILTIEQVERAKAQAPELMQTPEEIFLNAGAKKIGPGVYVLKPARRAQGK